MTQMKATAKPPGSQEEKGFDDGAVCLFAWSTSGIEPQRRGEESEPQIPQMTQMKKRV
jgi:hypothetical protein